MELVLRVDFLLTMMDIFYMEIQRGKPGREILGKDVMKYKY